ncbi:MAG TPA: tetratricopeptide repeat protein [Rhodocyclaceae bacterium]|nr:tetratricopeptide repeat protein [Rhodocyclaceae bacterium]
MPPTSTELRAAALVPALLLLALASVWLYSLAGPFQFDDWNVIVEQPAVHSLAAWWQAMPGMRPLLKLSYALNWSGPDRAASFHLVNLLIHATNVGLVWRLLQRWPHLSRAAAGWATLIFALHPVQTEAVTYIAGRSMSLMALFWLAAALAWLNGRRGLAAMLFVAALATRETAWSLPLLLLVWHRVQGFSWAQSGRRLWPLWLALLIAVTLILALPAYQRTLANALATRDPLANLALQVHVLSYLLVEPLLLWRNNIDPVLPAAARFDFAWWLGLAVIAAWLGLAGRWLSRRPGLGLALLWPLLLLLPTNGLIARADPASERHLYLALLGPAVLLCHGLASLLAPRALHRVGAVLCLALASATLLRIHDYRSESALWQATARRSPDRPRVWNNLGYAYLVEGRPDLALPALRRALQLDPDYLRAQLNLERAESALAASGDAAVAAPLKNQ